MKATTQPADNKNDQPDAATKYKNFQNRRLSQSTDSSDDTIGNFVNPVFRDKSLKSNSSNSLKKQNSESYDNLNNKGTTTESLKKQNSESYDNLNFNNRTDSQGTQSNPTKQPTKKQRTDITKPPSPEQIEMGVHNHGYGDTDKPRPNSWNKSLTPFSPYAVDTPIGGPADTSRSNSLALQTNNKRNSISKNSDYSFIGEENPYAAPNLSPAYDVIPGQQKGQLPPPRQGTRKSNLAYESAVIQKKHTQVKKSDPKEASDADSEGSGCCQLIFTVLVGLIAIVALLVVFLMVFGIVSAKKCKECDIVQGKRYTS